MQDAMAEAAMGRSVGGLGALHDRLHGKLWHTTHPELFPMIMASGGLAPEPNIEDARRWKTSGGPDYYPFVRKMGGVSLFDFEAFDPVRYDEMYPLSTWRTFVPHMENWGGAVWIEIDRVRVAPQLVSPDEVVRLWNKGGHHRHTIMPSIEAACIGHVPREVFNSVFLTWASGERVLEISLAPFDAIEFGQLLDEWRSYLA